MRTGTSAVNEDGIPLEWLYARFQAVGLAESRYLLLLLITSAYTLAAHLTGGLSVDVPFLGLKVERRLVETFAVSVLGILAFAFLGTAEAADDAFVRLSSRLGRAADGLFRHHIDEHPNVLDFLGFATRVGRMRYRGWRRLSLMVLYPVPLVAVLAWAVVLWWVSVKSYGWKPEWLAALHIFNATLLVASVWQALRFLYRRAKEIQEFRRQATN